MIVALPERVAALYAPLFKLKLQGTTKSFSTKSSVVRVEIGGGPEDRSRWVTAVYP